MSIPEDPALGQTADVLESFAWKVPVDEEIPEAEQNPSSMLACMDGAASHRKLTKDI